MEALDSGCKHTALSRFSGSSSRTKSWHPSRKANLSDRRKPCLGPSRGGVNRRLLKSERPNQCHGIAAATVIIEPFVMNRLQRVGALVSPSYPKGLLSALKLLRSRRNYKGKEIPSAARNYRSQFAYLAIYLVLIGNVAAEEARTERLFRGADERLYNASTSKRYAQPTAARQTVSREHCKLLATCALHLSAIDSLSSAVTTSRCRGGNLGRTHAPVLNHAAYARCDELDRASAICRCSSEPSFRRADDA